MPARDFADAARRFAALRARDGGDVSPEGASRWFEHGARTPLAVVLFHGLTNAPQQWDLFARALFAAGHTAIVPRFPGHGERDRTTRALARVSASDLIETASEAIAIAAGAGTRVVAAGISLGGTVAAWLARDPAVARAVAIAPLIGLKGLPAFADRALAALLRAAPNVFLPWDPGGDQRQIPPYAYPTFPTRLLAETMRLGFEVDAASRAREAFAELTMLLNAYEPAIANARAEAIVKRLAARGAPPARTIVATDFPHVHDVIDPTNPYANPAVVYPRVRAEIERL